MARTRAGQERSDTSNCNELFLSISFYSLLVYVPFFGHLLPRGEQQWQRGAVLISLYAYDCVFCIPHLRFQLINTRITSASMMKVTNIILLLALLPASVAEGRTSGPRCGSYSGVGKLCVGDRVQARRSFKKRKPDCVSVGLTDNCMTTVFRAGNWQQRENHGVGCGLGRSRSYLRTMGRPAQC